jgi:long-subunit fatty acid transport protein
MKKLWLVAMFLIAGFPLWGQAWDINLSGAGARAEGFGQAFIGVADDATSLVWNPGGLTHLQKMEASIVSKFVSSENKSYFKPTFASVVWPVRDNIVVAAAYQEQINYTFDFGTFDDEDGNSIDWSSEGGAKTVTMGLAYRISPLVSVGIAGNVWFGGAEWNYDGIDFDGNPFSGSFDDKAKGINGVLGLKLDLSGMDNPVPLKLGAVIRTPGAEALEGFDMPLMAGVGAAYQIGENFTVSLDGELRNFEQTDKEFGRNTFQIRGGAEYLIVADAGVFPLRTGYRTSPSPYEGIDDGYAISGGSGFIHDRFAFDVTYTFLKDKSTGLKSHLINASIIAYLKK